MNHASLESITEKQKKRYQVLLKLYELVGDDQIANVSEDELAEVVQISKPELSRILQYLFEERLVDFLTFTARSITHKGIREVEDSIQHPNRPTEHFPAVVIQHFYGDVNGGVQVGGKNNKQEVLL